METPLKFKLETKLIVPVSLICTVPLKTEIVCAVPGVNSVPLMLIIVKVSSTSASLSPANGSKTTDTSSLVAYASSTAIGSVFSALQLLITKVTATLVKPA